MKIVVGLGNPGDRYTNTRHNIGARIVEFFGAECGMPLRDRKFGSRFGSGQLARGSATPLDVAVLLPETFMNRSGDAVLDALTELQVGSDAPDFLVVFDDLDLPFGQLRIRPSGGSAGHRGLESVIERLGHQDFPRLRFGIGRPVTPIDTVDWVLQTFSATEETALEEHVPRAVAGIQAILMDGVTPAMNRYNRSPDEESESS